jgi:hypothetical protein
MLLCALVTDLGEEHTGSLAVRHVLATDASPDASAEGACPVAR